MKRKTISEAPESNAGDDFHVLWAIRKCFGLLNFEDNGLKAITVEGVEPKNASKLDPLGTKLLGVDIAEYFGGENFNEAQKVVISQLKYSTRRTSENWTFSKLYAGKKSGSTDGSVVHRFSQIYKTFVGEFGRDLVQKKLSIKLVSNRKISPTQKQIIIDIQRYIEKKKSKINLKTILNEFPNRQVELNKLLSATRLKPNEFLDFLRLLDFEDCGTDSNYFQELKIIEALRNVGILNPQQNDSLYRMLLRKMLPEAIEDSKNIITEIDLLQCLQMSIEGLFPVPQSFEKIEKLIERKQVETLIDNIIKNKTGKPICLHGGAGIGKSTISQLIKKKISLLNRRCFLFDCYGSGAYLNPSDSRHLHKEAILQISNEMAKKIGSPFLLNNNNESHILIREFKRRVEDAIRIFLKNINPNALLVLIIDAADNSVTAAEKSKTKSFIQDLINENYDEGFRLIVTSRTYRVSTLGLPKNYIDTPLIPFDLEETEKHLKFSFPQSTKEEVEEFHILTNQIPRVQTYALDLKKEGISQLINYLKPNGKKVEDLIQEKIDEAAQKIGNNGNIMIDSFLPI
ncbi:MAG: ATP-binding protein [Saprospiraceae bacterium]|nr:ATP-binding protein [Saprospiraceae bacterium]